MVQASWNVMAHTQKPDFVFRRNERVHLNRRGRQFSRLLADEVCASAVVMLDTPCSEVVWSVLATHCIRQFLLHFPSRASPCAITFQLESTHRHILVCEHLNSVETSWNVVEHAQKPDFVQSTTGSRGVRISGCNAGYTMFRGSVQGTGYPLHSPVSTSIPLPCVTVCHHISTGVYNIQMTLESNSYCMAAVGRHRGSSAPDIMVTGQPDKPLMFAQLYIPLCSTINVLCIAGQRATLWPTHGI